MTTFRDPPFRRSIAFAAVVVFLVLVFFLRVRYAASFPFVHKFHVSSLLELFTVLQLSPSSARKGNVLVPLPPPSTLILSSPSPLALCNFALFVATRFLPLTSVAPFPPFGNGRVRAFADYVRRCPSLLRESSTRPNIPTPADLDSPMSSSH